MAEDWDNLIILDACRYHTFEQEHTLDGTLESRVSRGSTSETFIRENFVGRDLQDTVYVTANPYVPLIGDDVFHALLTVLDKWDDDLQTVMPQRVVDQALDAHESYPNKRLIVHFMQPHQPYIGTKGKEIRARMAEEVDVVGWEADKRESRGDLEGVKSIRAPEIDVLNITRNEVFEAYRENLGIVLDHVETLLAKLDGKSVITADHGELIGDRLLPISRPLYGHPGKLRTRHLRVVPWFVVESEDRRETFAEESDLREQVDEQSLESKLRALGYR